MRVRRRYRSAGGVVADGDRILVLRRRSEVRLPKGHVEPGETDLEAARREVGEEAGVTDLALVCDLGAQQVCFERDGWTVEREERCFLFRLAGAGTRARNHRDRRYEAVWLPWAEAEAAMTYGAEQEWVRRAAAVAGRG